MKKLLIANRAEIARRIIRTARARGLKTVQIYGLSDERNSFIHDADEAVFLEGNTVAETYLNIEQIIEIARSYQVDAIHPGFGFLSESPIFAQAVRHAGITFVGPSPEVIALTADKRAAKKLADDAQVPTLPSLQVSADNLSALETFTQAHGFPLLIKAAFGGGGRGMRIITSLSDAKEFIERASTEALKFFASPEVFIEPYLSGARHVEVQILADTSGSVITLGTRDCSMQRNHQKVLEEAPAPFLSDALSNQLASYATALAQKAGYTNAGTVEFLVAQDKIYFLEINARIQVEHPVTEAIYGIDLIDAQLQIAQGKTLKQIFPTMPVASGHAIEARICAENPRDNFSSNNGIIQRLTVPPHVRFDSGFHEGDTVSHEFDSMIAKVIAHGATREEACSNLQAALAALIIDGVGINTEFLLGILNSKAFQSGQFSTNTLDTPLSFCLAADDLVALYVQSTVQHTQRQPLRIFGQAQKKVSFRHQGAVLSRDITFHTDDTFTIGNRSYPCHLPMNRSQVGAETFIHTKAGQFVFDDSIQRTRTQHTDPTAQGTQQITSPLPGTIVKILVTPEESVLAGQTLLLLESMKMEHEIKSANAGTVKHIHVIEKSTIKKGTPLVTVG